MPRVGEEEEISGVVSSIQYRNAETGFTIFSIETSSSIGLEKIAILGKCATLWEGEEVKAKGKWVMHKQYGLQFSADTIICIVPSSKEGLIRYLSSGVIKGIGKVNAKKIVDYFGDATIDVISHNSARLQEVPGIGKATRERIKKSWTEQDGIRDVMIFLQANGFGAASAARIYRTYGDNTIALIKENPYRLCKDIWGIGFLKADAFAMKLGIPKDAIVRACAGLLYVLRRMSEEGHCFCEEPELLLNAERILETGVEILASALVSELEAGHLIREGTRIYLKEIYAAEVRSARFISELLKSRSKFNELKIDAATEWAEKRSKIEFSLKQRLAIKTALASKISVITGGPGVGKTTIIKALCEIWRGKKAKIVLVAPTGRASRRMAESTGQSAQTIHRLLKYMPIQNKFEFNEYNKLEGDIFVIDESSMIDIDLADKFLSAIPINAIVVFVGDIDQLPSVGPGNVLMDLINSKAIPCTKLDVIFRQKTGGVIVRNAHNVNEGHGFEKLSKEEEKYSDFFFLKCDDPELTLENVKELVIKRIPQKFGYSPLQDIQVLTPMRKNLLGADNINHVLQEAINPNGVAITKFGRVYRVGDRVMQLKNNYDKDVFNGDIGFVDDVDEEAGELVVNFDSRKVLYMQEDMDELIHAYATSIHKSQGSEYPAVVIVIATQHFKLLQRNLLYTAITRGRKLVCVVGSAKAVNIAIRNNETKNRNTTLAERINAELGNF